MIANQTALLTSDRFFSRGQRIPYVLIMMAAYLAAQITWEIVALSALAIPVKQNEIFSSPTYEEELEPTVLWRWGNYVDLYQPPTQPKATPAKDIKLKVVISGLVYSQEGSLAMLKVEKGPVKLFSEKDELKGGIILDKIQSNGILLRQGDLTKLVELEVGKSDLFLEPVSDVPETREVRQQPILREGPEPPRDSVESVTINQLSTDYQKEINRFQEKILRKPLEAIKDVELSPVEENGNLLGWSLKYNVNPALLRALGLLPTDVIISVNDISASELSSSPRIVAELVGLKEYKVVVRRDGATKTFNFKR